MFSNSSPLDIPTFGTNDHYLSLSVKAKGAWWVAPAIIALQKCIAEYNDEAAIVPSTQKLVAQYTGGAKYVH